MLPMHEHPSRCLTLQWYALYFAFLCTMSSFASAQLVRGQFFTRGLAISDSPAPHSQNNAGGNLNIAIDLSGNGKLPQEVFLPTSTSQTAYQSLEIYLVSAETNINLTVTSGPQFLQQEPGSTVKHLTWPIPTCVLSGDYNLTFYELSRINGMSCYSITPIPIVIKSQSASPCPGAPTPGPQPQPSSPPAQQPWLTPGFSATSFVYPPTSSGLFPSLSGTVPTNPQPSSSDTILNPSESGIITITLSPSPTTATFISTVTVPTTINGSATVFTTLTTRVTVSTVVPSGSGGAFLPVNSAASNAFGCLSFILIWVFTVVISNVTI